jgi:hypothetical protein
VIISHAGGPTDGPALDLDFRGGKGSGDRLSFDANGKTHLARTAWLQPRVMRPALKTGLLPGGILVLGSCGYMVAQNPAGKKLWLRNLRGWAITMGVPVYAAPGQSEPHLSKGIVAYGPEGRSNPIDLVGFAPHGEPLP